MEGGNQTVAIGSQFCSPQPLQLSMKKKVYFCAGHGYEVKDAYGNLVFTIENLLGFFSSKVLVFDAADIPILNLKSKKFSWHSRWQAFKGDSTNEKDLIFSAKISSIFQFTTKLDIFLANNISEEVCDFRMKTNFMESTCDIFAGQSSTLVAQMNKNYTAGSIFLGRDKFMVKVNPNVDYAFIVSLIVILEEIVSTSRSSSSHS
ncbi:protein LURP-one-related 10-like [Nicotiana sylvestris]|uniref:Protein LURP-one-related 10-like n=2 Tax=Nicotiana TaxID=4085 RepID=A0A1S4AX08_TOBAC|nr:PREDICTED: protein LURP-one-related 10-like [Nicotiana sylvestris]XP_016481162.1 PREDICTED: protein LURP-one-related 10-like [Nicotiana tabacum]